MASLESTDWFPRVWSNGLASIFSARRPFHRLIRLSRVAIVFAIVDLHAIEQREVVRQALAEVAQITFGW